MRGLVARGRAVAATAAAAAVFVAGEAHHTADGENDCCRHDESHYYCLEHIFVYSLLFVGYSFFWGGLQQERAYLEDECADQPGQTDGVDHCEESPFPLAALVLDGHNGADARHVEQYE